MTAPKGKLQRALKAWTELLGLDGVITDPERLKEAETATFATSQRIPAILRPGNRSAVASAMRVASELRIPIYPSSRGRNIGYGSRVPASDGSVLMELSRLDRIVELNEELAYLTLEPGVTFKQAHAFLRDQSSRLRLAAIGGPEDASVVANALERGDGTGPLGDVIDHTCAAEVVLQTGDVIRTGLSRFDGAKAARVFKWGLGPSLDGLFAQSTFGIVTELTVFLALQQPFLKEFIAPISEPNALPALVDRLRELALEGTLRGTFYLWNDFKALSKLRQYPFSEASGRTPLPNPWMDQFRKEWFGGAWNLTGAIEAPDDAIGDALVNRLTVALGRVTREIRFNPDPSQGRVAGVPSNDNLSMAYWRKRTPMGQTPDPERDRCGFLWLSVAVPFLGNAATDAAEIARSVLRSHAFEPNLSFTAISPRCLYLIALIVYDREVAGEDARAMACHDAMLRELSQAGYVPARLGIQTTEVPVPSDAATDALVRRLKRVLDPAGILAPGRYGI